MYEEYTTAFVKYYLRSAVAFVLLASLDQTLISDPELLRDDLCPELGEDGQLDVALGDVSSELLEPTLHVKYVIPSL